MSVKQRRKRLRDLDDLLRDAAAVRLRELVELQRVCSHEIIVGKSYSKTDTLGNYTSYFTAYRLCLTCGLEEMRYGDSNSGGRRYDRSFEALEAPRSKAEKVESLSSDAYDKQKRNWLTKESENDP